MSEKFTPKPPDHLGPAGKAFWGDILKEYSPQIHDLARLEVACDAKDCCAEARKILQGGYDRNAANTLTGLLKDFVSNTQALRS